MAISQGLQRGGWPVGEVACQTLEKAVQRVAALGDGEPVCFDDMCHPSRPTPKDPVILLVSVPDDHIRSCASRLAARPWAEGSVALHLSGSMEVDTLADLAASGLAIGGFHPLRSLINNDEGENPLAGTVLAIEGDPAAINQCKKMAATLEGRPFLLAPESRAAWHAAATHACSHLVSLVDQALDLMESAGLDREEALHALEPLLESTLTNLSQLGPSKALTGPVVRGDLGAILRHLQALGNTSEDVGTAYRALARRAVRLARQDCSLDDDLAAEIIRALTGSSS